MRFRFATGTVLAIIALSAAIVAGGDAFRKPSAGKGEEVLKKNVCTACHAIKGVGGKVGPDLWGVSTRRKPEWISDQLIDPKKHNSKSVMPSFAKLPKQERADLAAYLGTLK